MNTENSLEQTLTEPLEGILSERGAIYGEFSGMAHITQSMEKLFWDHVDMEGQGADKFDPDMRESIHMIFHKLARIANGDPGYLDNWVDGGGYFELVARRLRKEKCPVTPKTMNVEELYKAFDLDVDSGELTWRPREENTNYDKSWNSKYAGKVAGSRAVNGYWRVCVLGKTMKLHRVIFAMFSGKDPEGSMVDHINRNKDDNRPANLRLASGSENQLNRKASGISGYPGVAWSADSGKWKVSLRKDGARRHLGYYGSITDAIAARDKAFETLVRNADLADQPSIGGWRGLETSKFLQKET